MSIESRSSQYGVVFDHWQIKEFLGSGSGGKSAVFRLARLDSHRGGSALKVINLIEERGNVETLPDYRREEYEQVREECKQFAEQEVWLMDELHGNTNIVDYLDHKFVEWSDETSFGCDMLIRMELLKDLRGRLKEGRRYSEEEILKIGRDICTALILCHGKEILHRDIKPENIFINADGNFKLGDFGVSRILSSAPAAMASTGIGTPEYAAPEQFTGNHDKRVDIYSLGLVLYELSNGNRLPFASSSYARPTDVQRRQMGEKLPLPSNASTALAEVILKACAYKKENRYQTAEEFLEALNSIDGQASAPKVQKLSNHNMTQRATAAESNNMTQRAYADGRSVGSENETVRAKAKKHSQTVDTGNKKKHGIILGAALAILGTLIFVILGGRDPCADGHAWEPATCELPKTCGECGETQGEAAGHQWKEADYYAPKTCRVCDKIEGEKLKREEITQSIMETAGRIGSGGVHTVVLKSNGRAIGRGSDDKPNAYHVSDWSDLIAVSCGDYYTLGLHSDGTVSATGISNAEKRNLEYWHNIIAIAAGDYHAVGLCMDGMVVIESVDDNIGKMMAQVSEDRLDAYTLNSGVTESNKIIAIAAGFNHTVALYSDGTVRAVGNNSFDQCQTGNWRDIIAIYAGANYTIGMRSDHTLCYTGSGEFVDKREVESWTDVEMVAAGDCHVVAVTKDGRILKTEIRNQEYDKGQCDLEDWESYDIVAIGAGWCHTVALTSDGTILAEGEKEAYRDIDGQNISMQWINELPFIDKYGTVYCHRNQEADYVYSGIHFDNDVSGKYQSGRIKDIRGDTHIYGIHVDGSTSGPHYITYYLDGKYTEFSGWCGIAGYFELGSESRRVKGESKTLMIFCDGKLKYTSSNMSLDSESNRIWIDVTGVKELRIEYGTEKADNDLAVLYDGLLQ